MRDRGHQRDGRGGQHPRGQPPQPVEPERGHREQQVGEPLRGQRPRRPDPGRPVEVGVVPHLHARELAHPLRDADDRLHRLERDVAVVPPRQLGHQPQPEDVQHDEVERPHPAQARPDEAGGDERSQRRSEPVEVGVGDHEAGDDEEQVDAQRALGDQRAEDPVDRRHPGQRREVEVEPDHPQRRDDPEPGQRLQLTGRGRLIAGWGGSARRCRHGDRNEVSRTSGAGDTRNPPVPGTGVTTGHIELGRTGGCGRGSRRSRRVTSG